MKKILKILCTFCLLLWITLLLFTLLLSFRINPFSHARLLRGCLLNLNFAPCDEVRSKQVWREAWKRYNGWKGVAPGQKSFQEVCRDTRGEWKEKPLQGRLRESWI